MSDHSKVVVKIINCVKAYPALYDPSHEDYYHHKQKKEIWNEIAAAMNYSDGKVVQTKWRNLRDAYVKHLRWIEKEESADKKFKNLQCVNEMAFLKKYISANRPESNENVHGTAQLDDVESVCSEDCYSLDDDVSAPSTPLPSRFDLHRPSRFNGMSRNQRPVKYFRSFSAPSEDCPVESGSFRGLDAIDLLFLSHSKTLKSMAAKRQIDIKIKINAIMSQAEMDEIIEKARESNHVDSSSGNDHFRS